MKLSLTKRKVGGRIYVDLRPLGLGRRSLGTADPKTAKARVKEVVGLVGGATLDEANRRVMASRWATHKAPPEKVYRAVRALLGNVRMGDLDKACLDRLVALSRAAGAAPATINRRLAYLSVLLRDAMDREEIERLPRLPKQREPESTRRAIDRATEDAIASWFRANGLADLARLVEVAVDTGLRLSELLRLEPNDLRSDATGDGGAALLVRQSKSDRPRTIPLTKRSRAACLQGMWTTWTTHRVEHHWQAMRKALGRPELVFHQLRHTCATRLTQAGMDTRKVQVWMGHSSIVTTTRYAHVNTADLISLRDALQAS